MNVTGQILLVDDEAGIRELCSDILGRAGHRVRMASSGEEGWEATRSSMPDLILLDINLPGMSGIELLEKLLAEPNPPTVILMTAYPSVETAVRGMKLGARDYLTKPFTPDELRLVAARAIAEDALRKENSTLRDQLAYRDLIGESQVMRELRQMITRVASSEATVLITGESGTGKELVARALHFQGDRAERRFVAVNCGALVGDLLESELFGHKQGAFTGAVRDKPGLFVVANGGTLFLDELAELPLELQPKLLRAVQEGEVTPVGGVSPVRTDARVIAATHRNLEREVEEGRLREDLFYRLNVITLEVPALRERREDIPVLARHFAELAAARSDTPRVEIDDEAIAWLSEQAWPGNVRELENSIERAVVLANGPTLGVSDFRATTATPRGETDRPGGDELLPLDEIERNHILRVLDACEGHKTRAAAILGINRTTLWKKLRQYGVE